jgi:hypothetical protein
MFGFPYIQQLKVAVIPVMEGAFQIFTGWWGQPPRLNAVVVVSP